jgi:uncharacterized protein (TIGR02678 family)
MNAQAQQLVADRRAAMRALLAHPLLAAARHGEELALVRIHAEWLREWLGRNCGWTLQVDAEQARLRKTPADHLDGSRGARDSGSGLLFSRRRYALFCLALTALERGDRQTTLGNIADEVSGAMAAEPGFAAAGMSFDLGERECRRDLVHVVRLLLELRVLVRLHGQEEHFVERRGDVLYNVVRPALACLLAVRRAPSTISAATFEKRLAALVQEPVGQGEEARNRQIRQRLMRRLLDDPVIYYDELDGDERAYLISQRPHLLRLIEEATGLAGEVRREGIALVDPEGTLTDLGMPEQGTEGHVALLVAEFLAGKSRARVAPAGAELGVVVPMAEVVAHVAAKKREHRAHWRKDALAPGAEVALAAQALATLEALRLVTRAGDGVRPRPAVGRFRLLAPTVRARGKAAIQTGLFGDPEGAGS